MSEPTPDTAPAPTPEPAPELAEARDGTSYIVLRDEAQGGYQFITNMTAASVDNAYAILKSRAEAGNLDDGAYVVVAARRWNLRRITTTTTKVATVEAF